MTLRFYRRIRILPGLRANIGKRGVSLSIGGRGAWYTIGSRGRRVTLGLPGTGIYWSEKIPPARPVHVGHQAAASTFTIVVILAAMGTIIFIWQAVIAAIPR